MKPKVTLDQLLHTILEDASCPEEVLATAIHMVNSGAVELIGSTARTELDPTCVAELDDYLLAA